MCTGPGVGEGAAVVTGNDAIGGWGLPPGDTPGSHGGGSNVGLAPSGMDAAKAALPKGAVSNADVAKGVSLAPIPGVSAILGVIGYSGGFDGEGGDVTSGALGGPGADPRPAWAQGQPSYQGPPAPVAQTTYSGPTVIEPSIRSGAYYSVERGRTPEEIDAANRLRMAREQAYAKQRAQSEAELLKALGRRDVALTGGLGGRLSETPKASEKFVGTPPVLGQSRHYWA